MEIILASKKKCDSILSGDPFLVGGLIYSGDKDNNEAYGHFFGSYSSLSKCFLPVSTFYVTVCRPYSAMIHLFPVNI